jgi:RimJ/RimL family protein N-acetyltransferase
MTATHIITETGRLIIRPLTEVDVPVIASLWADERVTRFMGGPREFEKVSASLRDDLNAPPLRLDLWPVVEKSTGKVVGHCGLLPKTVDGIEQVELVYVIAAGSWGCGYATEAALALRDHALRSLRIPRLISLIDPANTASERVALKAGMKFDAETIRPGGKAMRVYALKATVLAGES